MISVVSTSGWINISKVWENRTWISHCETVGGIDGERSDSLAIPEREATFGFLSRPPVHYVMGKM